MNIAVDRIKPSIAPYRGVSFTSTHYGVSTAFQGEIKEVRGSSCIISYWCDGDLKEVQLPIDRVTVQESLTETWWRDIVGVPPLEKVLGDSEDLKEDALGNMDPKGIKVGDLVDPSDFYEGNRNNVDAELSLLRRKSGMVRVLEVSPIILTLESEAVLGYDITVQRRDCRHFERPVEEIAPLKIDAIGRGKKGFGHGSIDMKPVRRKRKNGRIWEKYQAWYQWEDEVGKHCRYLRKGVDLTVQRLIDEGATVEMILESIGKSKDSSKGKTR